MEEKDFFCGGGRFWARRFISFVSFSSGFLEVQGGALARS